MPSARPFAYNPGSPILGTEQVGDIAVGVDAENYSGGYGGVRWWNGPDEELGYVICYSVPTEDHPSPDGPIGGVGFFRSQLLTESSFITIAEYVSNGQIFSTGNEAKTWLNNNGYWTSYETVGETPTPTITPTNTLTPSSTASPTSTPTNTTTPTNTPTPSLTPTMTPSNMIGVTFSQAFVGGQTPTTPVVNAWIAFRALLTGSYTSFTWSSTNGNSLTVSHPTNVQLLADGLRTNTITSVTIDTVNWNVGLNCGPAGAVEFSNNGSCTPSSTYALRPQIGNSNWGGTNEYTVGAPSQTITLTFF